MSGAIDPSAGQRVRLVSLDVDGVLTDGSLWVATMPLYPASEMRRFHVLDGMAIRLLQQVGIVVAFVSGKRSNAVRVRAKELGVSDVSLGAREGKLHALKGMLEPRGWEFENVAHLGDDLADLPVMERVGLPAAVVNAVPEVLASAEWVGTVPGGSGAVREFAEALLVARGEWDDLLAGFREGGRFAGMTLEEIESGGRTEES